MIFVVSVLRAFLHEGFRNKTQESWISEQTCSLGPDMISFTTGARKGLGGNSYMCRAENYMFSEHPEHLNCRLFVEIQILPNCVVVGPKCVRFLPAGALRAPGDRTIVASFGPKTTHFLEFQKFYEKMVFSDFPQTCDLWPDMCT